MEKRSLQEIADIIKSSKKAVVLTHVRPDGDALGSALALSFALDFLGIEHAFVSESDPPSNLSFMQGLERMKKTAPTDADTLIAVDCADDSRLGEYADFWLRNKGKKRTVNVDHHISNTRFAKHNYVRECAANCMNIAELIKEMGVPFDEKIANALMTGLLTDSGNFSHDDVNEECFLLAAELKRSGAKVKELNENLFKRQPKARAGLYAETVKGMRFALDDKFAFIVITQENMKKYGADHGMTEGFVDFPLSVDGVEVAASLMEMKKGQYKISLRSKTYANVNQVAGVYGGGGHVRAAGCMLFGDLEDVLDRLTYTVPQYLE